MRLDVIHNDRCCLSALLVAHNAERIATKKSESGFLPRTAINAAGLHGVAPKEKPPAYKSSGLDINNRPEAACDGYLTQYLMLYNILGPKLTISDARIPQILEMRTPGAVK